jgi:predicted small integral membrane protein
MDTTFPGDSLLCCRLTSPARWNAAYCLIIFGEGLTGLTPASAAIALLRQLRSGADRFNRAKRFVSVGATCGFLVWFFGFMLIGGEWFQMWQSPSWNGQEAAFRFYLTILAVLIFVSKKDEDLAIRRDEG